MQVGEPHTVENLVSPSRERLTEQPSAEARRRDPAREILDTIGAGRGTTLRRWVRRLALLAVLGVLAIGALLWTTRGKERAATEYVSVPVQRGDLRATVEATGTVKALDQVEVGAEVSGTIAKVSADFNDRVEAGQILCEIDPERHAAAVTQARAQLAASRADYASREASATEAALVAERTKGLAERGVISTQELEAAVAAAARANAALRAASAQIGSAKAALASAEIALRKTKIHSPIDGVVLFRSVEPGQTVTASFQTPVLFTLARDLTKMEVEIDIDEADIGRVREGQEASFTVDAYPNRVFAAIVNSIHNLSTVVDNVVTYRAVLGVDNADLVLRPGMTTTVSIVTFTRVDALIVANAALRFTPPSKIQDDQFGPRFLRFGSDAKDRNKRASSSERPGATVWVLREGALEPIRIETGLSDGQWTEVVAGDLPPGTEVLVDVAAAGD